MKKKTKANRSTRNRTRKHKCSLYKCAKCKNCTKCKNCAKCRVHKCRGKKCKCRGRRTKRRRISQKGGSRYSFIGGAIGPIGSTNLGVGSSCN